MLSIMLTEHEGSVQEPLFCGQGNDARNPIVRRLKSSASATCQNSSHWSPDMAAKSAQNPETSTPKSPNRQLRMFILKCDHIVCSECIHRALDDSNGAIRCPVTTSSLMKPPRDINDLDDHYKRWERNMHGRPRGIHIRGDALAIYFSSCLTRKETVLVSSDLARTSASRHVRVFLEKDTFAYAKRFRQWRNEVLKPDAGFTDDDYDNENIAIVDHELNDENNGNSIKEVDNLMVRLKEVLHNYFLNHVYAHYGIETFHDTSRNFNGEVVPYLISLNTLAAEILEVLEQELGPMCGAICQTYFPQQLLNAGITSSSPFEDIQTVAMTNLWEAGIMWMLCKRIAGSVLHDITLWNHSLTIENKAALGKMALKV
jgi:hypothetical protein